VCEQEPIDLAAFVGRSCSSSLLESYFCYNWGGFLLQPQDSCAILKAPSRVWQPLA
jgi:hypothetical protein